LDEVMRRMVRVVADEVARLLPLRAALGLAVALGAAARGRERRPDGAKKQNGTEPDGHGSPTACVTSTVAWRKSYSARRYWACVSRHFRCDSKSSITRSAHAWS